jgi:hypothetical protein
LINQVIGGDLVQTIQSGDNPLWSQPLTNRIQLDTLSLPFSMTVLSSEGTQAASHPRVLRSRGLDTAAPISAGN